MVLIDSVKYACATCIKGHRSSTCNHETRPLIEIKKKGRPVTQCVHCRELRKTKQVHVKCLCEGRPETSASTPRTVLPAAAAFAPASACATKTAANNTRSNSTLISPLGTPSCDCKSGGPCVCCTLKHAPRRSTAAALESHSASKPAGLTRSNTYHAASPNPPSMNHEASLSSHQVTKGGSSLQRSTSLHGASAGGSHPHLNVGGSHHPQPQHHYPRHFAPYHIAHHNHHHHARFDMPEEEKDQASINLTGPGGTYRRHRSSSVSHSDVSRPFPPPTPVYANGSGAVSMPDVLAWSSGDVSPISPYNQQPSTDPLLADAARSSTFLPQAGSEYDAFAPASADELICQLGNSNRVLNYTAGDATAGDLQYSAIPDFQFTESADVGLEQQDQSPLFTDNAVYGGPSATAEYDPMMATFLSLPQQASASALSGSGAGSSPPPSMTGSGSLTSRSSSRASGAAFDFYDMTAADASCPGDSGRLPRQYNSFPITDPFESESTTAIPSFESFDRPLQNQPSPIDIDKALPPNSPDKRDDGNGTQFPAWPHHTQPRQLTSSPISSTNLSSAGLASFEGDSYEFGNPSGTVATALAYGGHRGPSLEFDDNEWAMRA